MGLDRFDKLVRNELKQDVYDTLNGLALIPYPMALAFSIFNGLVWFDAVWLKDLNYFLEFCFLADIVLLSGPIYLGTSVYLAMLWPSSSNRSCSFIEDDVDSSTSLFASLLSLGIENICSNC